MAYGGEIMDNDRNSLSAKLEALRKKKGLTQKDVADILKVNRTTYTKYETGVTEPNISALRKLAEIFEVDLNLLLADDDNFAVVSDSAVDFDGNKTQEFVKLFNKLSEKDKEKLISQMKKRVENKK